MALPGVRLVFDFPSARGATERLCFSNPVTVLVADRLEEVRDVVARAEAHAIAGRFVAGYVAYDAAPGFESAIQVPGKGSTPLAWFGVFEHPAPVVDPTPAPAVIPCPSPSGIPGAAKDPRVGHDGPHRWTPNAERVEYDDAIERIRTAIGNGEVYQVNYTLRLRSASQTGAFTLYERLRGAQQPEFAAFLDSGQFQIVSASPELFFSRRGDAIETRPMKGTSRRGRWLDEDRQAGRALSVSEKDRAENLMIVDLLRNDIGKVAVTGSVHTPALLTVERYPTVWQMTSTVTGTLRPGTSLVDIFTALFPSGSVTGAPKIAATHAIAALESAPRGVYCGAIGLLRPGGDCTFNVAIRTVVIDTGQGTAEYGVGGGITYDSTPAGEYDELLAKTAILSAASADIALVETLRLVDGVYVRREAHLARLGESAEYLGFPDPRASAGAALDDHAASLMDGSHRVRLRVHRHAAADVASTPFSEAGVNQREPIVCALGRPTVNSGDVYLFHKTTRRNVYDRARAEQPEADDVLLVNERGELTEFTIGNLVVEIDGIRYTPPRECGLLAGVFRQELLATGAVRERTLRVEDLERATAIWRINSLREWTPVRLPR